MVQMFIVTPESRESVKNIPKNQITQARIAIQNNYAAVIGKSLFSGSAQFYQKGSLSVGVGSVRNAHRKMGRT